MRIQDMFAKDIDRSINGVVKVAQDDDADIRQELEEYVVTDELRRHLATLFDTYARALGTPTDRIGVWISGFFGSGKSHFLKMLSYLLSGREVAGCSAQACFEEKLADDPQLLAQMQRCCEPTTEAILFNIDSKGDIKKDSTAVLRVFAQVFFDHLGFYGKDLKLARLERYVDAKGKTAEFRAAYEEVTGTAWVDDRENYEFNADELAEALASAGVMSESNALAWVDGSEQVEYSIDAFTDDVRDYAERRAQACGGEFRLLFMADEVGQYIGNDVSLMLNLQTIVEELGTKCAGRVWVMVTSQEAIDAVTTNLVGNDFSKIQGRFNTRLSLSSSSVDEVIERRILEKTEAAHDTLVTEYATVAVSLRNLFTFEQARGDLTGFSDAEQFSATFPFVPYQFDLLQDVFDGLRTTGSSGKHLSHGERSMLSGFQEAAQVVEDADERVLVPFWRFYDTLHEFLEGYIRRVVDRADQAACAGDKGLEPEDIPVLKLLFLLKNVDKSLKATLPNLAILMADSVDVDIVELRERIQASLDRLVRRNNVARSGDTYVFLTDEEQEIAGAISREEVDVAAVLDSVAKALFGSVYEPTKASRGVNDFPLQRFVDDTRRSGRDGELVLRMITNAMPPQQRTAEELHMRSSNNDGECVVALAEDEGYFDALRQAAKIEKYRRTNNVSAMPDSAQVIVQGKGLEQRRLTEQATEMLERAVRGARFFVAGSEIKPSGATAKAKVDDALRQLIERRFTKLDYVEQHATGDADIVAILKAPETLDGSVPNARAVAEVEEWLGTQLQLNVSTSMGDVQRHFSDGRYGWREVDIACCVAQLVHDQKVEVLRAGVQIALTDAKLPDYLRKRTEVDQVQVRRRVAVDPRVLRRVRSLYKELSGSSSVSSDEDGLASDVRELLETRRESLRQLLENRYEREPRYPGRGVVEQGVELFGKVLGAGANARELFDACIEHEDDLLDLSDELEGVTTFFASQSKVFDVALGLLDDVARDITYLMADDEAAGAVRTINEILELPQPYRRVQELVQLTNTVRRVHDGLLQRRKQEAEAKIAETYDKLGAYAAEQGVAEAVSTGFAERRRALVDEVEGCHAIADVELVFGRLSEREAEAYERVSRQVSELERKRREQERTAVRAREANAPSVSAASAGGEAATSSPAPEDVAPAATAPEPVAEPRIVRVQRADVLPPRVLRTEHDINRYVDALREALVAALADGDGVQLTN